MATFVFEGELLKTCPYNPAHRVSERRYLFHITKCAKDPKAPKLRVCPFNPGHRLPPSEFNNHLVECPDNRQHIREMLHRTERLAKYVPEEQSNQANNEEEKDPWASTSGEDGVKQYIMPGLEDKEDKDLELVGEGFISQQQLFGLKPAERKQVYNKLTEETIRRQARNEREQSTEGDARELELAAKLNSQIAENSSLSSTKIEPIKRSAEETESGPETKKAAYTNLK